MQILERRDGLASRGHSGDGWRSTKRRARQPRTLSENSCDDDDDDDCEGEDEDEDDDNDHDNDDNDNDSNDDDDAHDDDDDDDNDCLHYNVR